MFVLFIVLNEIDYLDDIMAEFVNIGVCGATILDSQGMASAIVNGQNKNIPLFGSLKKLLADARPYNKTIFTVLENEEMVDKTVASINKVLADASQPGAGFMFTMPIGKTYKIGKSE